MIFVQFHRPFEILLAEDNPGDVRLTREALRESNIHHHLHVVNDGVAVMEFLHHEGAYTGAPRPDLILLDLNMPRMDGRRALALIKNDAELRRIPVVILTSSQNETDIQTAYELQVNCYITKPADYDQFMSVVRAIEDFWTRTAELPWPSAPAASATAQSA